jgi:hypothetical protein
MKGGLGSAALQTPDGLIVAAIVAVNAAGDIIDPASGKIVAGTRTADGKALADARVLLRTGAFQPPSHRREHHASESLPPMQPSRRRRRRKVAEMAQDGYARAIFPSHTDGRRRHDLRAGYRPQNWRHRRQPDWRIGRRRHVAGNRRAVRQATGIPGYPAARDLNK